MDDGTVGNRLDGARNRDGTFGVGNRAASGNVNARKQFELRRALLESDMAKPETVKAVFARLTRLALGDREKDVPPDLDAMKIFLSYTLGRPTVAVELSGPDGEPLGVEWAKVEDAVIAALAPFGDRARFAVAAALRGLVKDAGGPESPDPPA